MFTSSLQIGVAVVIIICTVVLCYAMYETQDKFFPITNWTRLPYSDRSYGTWIALHALHDEILHRGAPSYLNEALGGEAQWTIQTRDESDVQLFAIRVSDVAKPVERPFRHLQYVEYSYRVSRPLLEVMRPIEFPGVSIEGSVVCCRGGWSGHIQCMMFYFVTCAINRQKYDDVRESMMADIDRTIRNPARGFELEQKTASLRGAT